MDGETMPNINKDFHYHILIPMGLTNRIVLPVGLAKKYIEILNEVEPFEVEVRKLFTLRLMVMN
jgi:hypothetical protein